MAVQALACYVAFRLAYKLNRPGLPDGQVLPRLLAWKKALLYVFC